MIEYKGMLKNTAIQYSNLQRSLQLSQKVKISCVYVKEIGSEDDGKSSRWLKLQEFRRIFILDTLKTNLISRGNMDWNDMSTKKEI